MYNRLFQQLALGVLALAFAGWPTAGQETRPADTVIFELASPIRDAENFNWYTRQSTRDAGAHQAMWEPLFILNYATGELEPWLGLSIETDDQKVWTLKLREGVYWSDGVAFTSADVKFTADMVIKHYDQLPATEASTFARNFILLDAGQMASVTALGTHTVEFVLKEANPRFALENFGAGLFSSFLIMPKHRWEAVVASGGSALTDFKFLPPIGTGPYRLDPPDQHPGSVSSNEVYWTLDEDWWGARDSGPGEGGVERPVFRDLPVPKHLVWRYFGTEQDSAGALFADALDAPLPYSPALFEQLASTPTLGVTLSTWGDIPWNEPCARQLEINLQFKDEAGNAGTWTNRDLREALSLIIDRDALARDGYSAAETPLALTVPSTTMFADYGAMAPFISAIASTNLAHTDREGAEDIIGTLGYIKNSNDKFEKAGTVLTATIVVNAEVAIDKRAIAILESQLEEQGIEVIIEEKTNQDYWGQVIPKGEYEIAFGWLSCGSVAEPYTSMSRYLDSKVVPVGDRAEGFANTGRWESRGYSEKVEELGDLPLGDPRAPGLVAAAYQFIANEVPFIPLVQSPKFFVFNTKHWVGWPSSENCKTEVHPPPGDALTTPSVEPNEIVSACQVPMHNWSSMHRVLFELRKSAP